MSANVPAYCERPGPLAALAEMRTPLEGLKFLLRFPQLLSAPRGDGRPIALAPGYLAGDYSMMPLAQYLKYLGYDVHPWGLGNNNGDVEDDIERFGERIEALHQDVDGAPITLIGWSLGGVVAREVARLKEPYVREVITLGTPVIGGPKYTTVGQFYAYLKGVDLEELEKEVHDRNAMGLAQPVTSIYSKTDGIVAWQASVDVYNAHARNIPVSSTHFGIGVNPRVWRLIADILAGTERDVIA